MKVTACIFDMDGLLIDSERIALRVFEEVCLHYDCVDQYPLYEQLLGTNAKTTRLVLNESLPASINVEEFIDRWTLIYGEETKQAVPVKKGILELLDFLESVEIPKVVATSTKTSLAKEKLEKSGIIHRFSTVIGGDQVSQGKPAPEIYTKAAQFLNIESAYCLALEDSPNGVKSALAANMHVVQIPDTVQPDDALRSMGHHILDNALDVITLLKTRL